MSQTPPDPFEFLKTLWGPMGLPMAGMIAPIMNVSEVERRIADLRSVEHWLNLNLNVLRMTIQGLEMQRATLSAMQSLQQGAQPPQNPASVPLTGNPLADAWWQVLQQGQGLDPGPGKK